MVFRGVYLNNSLFYISRVIMMLTFSLIFSLLFLVLADKIVPNKKGRNLNVIYYDLETYQTIIEKDEKDRPYVADKGIITSAVFKEQGSKSKCFTIGVKCTDHDDLINQISHYFTNPNNVLCAWNGSGYDDLIIKENISDVKCQFFDLMKGYSKFIERNVNDMVGLNSVASKIGYSKKDVNPITAYKKQEYKLLEKYCEKDVYIMSKIDEHFNIMNSAFNMRDFTGTDYVYEVLWQTKPLASYMNKLDYKIGKNNHNPKSNIVNCGGLNYAKSLKSQYHDLNHFDVRSFYPYMFLCLNGSSDLSYDNIKVTGITQTEFEDLDLLTVNDKFYFNCDGTIQVRIVDKDFKKSNRKYRTFDYVKLELVEPFNVTGGCGDIAKLTKHLVDKKNTTSKSDILYGAYKVLVNGLYGALDSKYFKSLDGKKKYTHKNLSSACTFMCRLILWNCIQKYDCKYAKTDSVWGENLNKAELEAYCAEILKTYGLNYKDSDGSYLIQWDDESNGGIDTLYIRNYLQYIETYNNGDTPLFKGDYPLKAQKLLLEDYIKDNDLDIAEWVEKHIHDISLFSKWIKLSSKQLNQDRFNVLLTEIMGYPYVLDFKVNNYLSEYGYVNSEIIEDNMLPVDYNWALHLCTKILNEFGFNVKVHPEPELKTELPIVPIYKNANGRYLLDKKAIAKAFNIPKKKLPKGYNAYTKLRLGNVESKYKGLLCHPSTGYYFFDIDEDVDNNFKNLSGILPTDKYYWTYTRSNKYHLVLKSIDDQARIVKLNEYTKPNGIEIKGNAIHPLTEEYSKLPESISILEIENKNYKPTFINNLKKIGLLPDKLETKETKPRDVPVQYNITDTGLKRLFDIYKTIFKSGYRNDITYPLIHILDGIGYDEESIVRMFESLELDTDYDFRTKVRENINPNKRVGKNRLVEMWKMAGVNDEQLKEVHRIIKGFDKLYDSNPIIKPTQDIINRLEKLISDYNLPTKELYYHFNLGDWVVNTAEPKESMINYSFKKLVYTIPIYHELEKGYKETVGEFTERINEFQNKCRYELFKLHKKFKRQIFNSYKEQVLNMTYNDIKDLFLRTWGKQPFDLIELLEPMSMYYSHKSEIQHVIGDSGTFKSTRSLIEFNTLPDVWIIDDATLAGLSRMSKKYGSDCFDGTVLYYDDVADKGKPNKNFKECTETVYKKAYMSGVFDREITKQNSDDTIRLILTWRKYGVKLKANMLYPLSNIDDGQSKSRTREIPIKSITANEFKQLIKDGRYNGDQTSKIDPRYFKNIFEAYMMCNEFEGFSEDYKTKIMDRSIENNKGLPNAHKISNDLFLHEQMSKLYKDDYTESFANDWFSDNNSVPKLALELKNEIEKMVKTKYKLNDLGDWNKDGAVIAKTKSSYSHRSKYNYDAFTFKGVRGMRTPFISKISSRLQELLDYLVEEQEIAVVTKPNETRIYVLLE